MVARVLAPKPKLEAVRTPPAPAPVPTPAPPPPIIQSQQYPQRPDSLALAMNAIVSNTEEANRINAMLAEHIGNKRQFYTEVVSRDDKGRIKSLRTVEQ